MRSLMRVVVGAGLLLLASVALAADVQVIDPSGGIAQAAVVGNLPLAHTAQFLPVDEGGKIVGKGSVPVQLHQVLKKLDTALAEAKSSLDRVVKLNIAAAGPEVVAVIDKELAKKFSGANKPAVTFVTGALPHADALLAIDAIAVCPEAKDVTRSKSLKLPGRAAAHVAIMPAGARVYIAGQAEKGDDLLMATRKTLESLRATLKFLDLDDTHVVQVKSFMTPMARAGDVEKEIVNFFGNQTAPPMVFVEWTYSLIEIELIAWAGKEKEGEPIEYLTPPAMKASPLYSRVARINHGPTIYVSGLYGSKGATAAEEIKEIFAGLEQLLGKTGSDFRHLAKATYYVASEDASKKLNELRPTWYDPRRPPSASKAMVAGTGRAGRSITIDMIAVPKKK